MTPIERLEARELHRVKLSNQRERDAARAVNAANRERDAEPFGSLPSRQVVNAITTEQAPEPFDATDTNAVGGAA